MRDKNFGSHEMFVREDVSKTSSNKNFGLVFAGFFALLALSSYYFGHSGRWPYWLGLSIVFAVVAYVAPRVLAPLNRCGPNSVCCCTTSSARSFSGFSSISCITPIGFLMRLAGKDPMRRKFEPAAKSYWIVREPPGPAPETFKNQF